MIFSIKKWFYLWPLLFTFESLAEQSPKQPSMLEQLFPFLLIGFVVYFIFIRPQQKKYKQHHEFLAKVKRGDEVLTNSGIFGKIEGITDQFIVLEVADKVRIRVLKNQIASLAYQSETKESKNKNQSLKQ